MFRHVIDEFTNICFSHSKINQEQMKLHIDLAMCSRKEPLIFRHRHSNNYTLSRPYKEVSNYKTATELCQEKMTHFPFLFIDECIDKLPSADFMSTFSIVLTTTKVRIYRSWKDVSHLKKSSIRFCSQDIDTKPNFSD